MKRIMLCAGIVVVCGLLSLPWLSSSFVRAQPGGAQLAAQARVVLEKNCARCHGITKASGKLDVRQYKTLITPGKKRTYVVPKDLKKSYLWSRIDSGDMPQEGEMTDGDKKIVRQWIEAGAPPYVTPVVTVKRPYVSTKDVLASIANHLNDAESDDRPYLRYFTLAHLHNNPDIPTEQLGRYRAALSKALNSLHWKKPIILPRPVDKNGTVLVFDLRDLDWDRKKGERADRWAILLGHYPYGMGYGGVDDEEMVRIDKKIDELTRGDLVYVRADWFVAFATRPPLYEAILRLPKTAYELETKLDVDVAKNFRRNRLARAGYARSFVSGQNRMVERHDALYGAYWKSYDFKKRNDKSSLVDFPLGPVFSEAYRGKYPYLDVAFQHDGGEMIFNLPNGLQGYYLTDAKGKHIDAGPIEVVSDDKKTSGTAEIVNGLSCMACHKNGMIDSVLDEVRIGNSVSGTAKQKVKRLYPPQPVMLAYVEEDKKLFLSALEKAVVPFLAGNDKDKPIADVTEPIGELVRDYYNPDLTLAKAAYELGFEKPETLKEAAKTNEKLRQLGVRKIAFGGLLKREEWDRAKGLSLFQQTARHLGLGNAKTPER